jgi:hypothetical protein
MDGRRRGGHTPAGRFARPALAARSTGSSSVLWLSAIVLVPLTFGPPESFALFDVPKIALMRLIAAAIAGGVALDAALKLALVAVLSTLASPMRSVALWGFEEGRDGQSLLSVASVLTIFFAVALRLRTPAQAWRLAAAIAATTILAALYVIAQAVGTDPFELDRFRLRISGSFGNPIFAGAALLQGMPLIILLATLAAARHRHPGTIAVGALAIAIAASALALTLSRGPWVGCAVAVVLTAVALW